MKYYNYNPHEKGLLVGDCVIRSIVCTTSMPYNQVRRQLNAFKKVTGAKSYNSDQNPHHFVEDVLNGKKISVENNVTVSDFCKMHPRGRFILDMDEHWSACVDGCIYDTWDCGKEKVNFTYEITTEPYTAPDLKNQVFKNCCTSEKISNTETIIRIYDGNGAFVERKIPTDLIEGYVLCLQHSNYQYIDLDGAKQMKCVL